VMAHFGAALVFSAVWMSMSSWLVAGERSVQTGEVLTFTYLIKKLAIHYCVVNLLMYWLVVLGHLGWITIKGCASETSRRRNFRGSWWKRGLMLCECSLTALSFQHASRSLCSHPRRPRGGGPSHRATQRVASSEP